MAFVRGIKTASVSLASAALPLKLGKTRADSRRHFGHRSSRSEDRHNRLSVDSNFRTPAGNDIEVRHRAVQRRRILEELISSEESYIGDLKVLVDIYETLLATLPALTQPTRHSIKRNLMEILELHEDFLGELHRVIPNSEFNSETSTHGGDLDVRRREIVPSTLGKSRVSSSSTHATAEAEEKGFGMSASPQIVNEVATVFDRMVRSLLLSPKPPIVS